MIMAHFISWCVSIKLKATFRRTWDRLRKESANRTSYSIMNTKSQHLRFKNLCKTLPTRKTLCIRGLQKHKTVISVKVKLKPCCRLFWLLDDPEKMASLELPSVNDLLSNKTRKCCKCLKCFKRWRRIIFELNGKDRLTFPKSSNAILLKRALEQIKKSGMLIVIRVNGDVNSRWATTKTIQIVTSHKTFARATSALTRQSCFHQLRCTSADGIE